MKLRLRFCLGSLVLVTAVLASLLWALSEFADLDGTFVEVQNFNGKDMTEVTLVGSTEEGEVAWTEVIPDVPAGGMDFVLVPGHAEELEYSFHFQAGDTAYSHDDWGCSVEGEGLVRHGFAFWEDNHVDLFCQGGDRLG